MGASDLRDSFNAVSKPRYTCTRATLAMTNRHDVEWQILSFSGISAEGVPFEIVSDLVRAGGDVNAAAGATAQTLLDRKLVL